MVDHSKIVYPLSNTDDLGWRLKVISATLCLWITKIY